MVAFAQQVLAEDGVFYGSTILGSETDKRLKTKITAGLFRRMKIFGQRKDRLDELQSLLYEICPEDKQKIFEETGDLDYAYEIPGVARFRSNLFMQKWGMAAVFRQIPSEILTAEYMMLNPIAAFSMDATGSFDNPEDYGEFKPTTLERYYSWSEDIVDEEVVEIQEWRILDPGSIYWDYPHAGVLNTQAFLFRYPTTARRLSEK